MKTFDSWLVILILGKSLTIQYIVNDVINVLKIDKFGYSEEEM